MLSTPAKGWVGTGALNFMSAMADSKKATEKQHWARDSKNKPSGPGPRGVWETFSTYFVPQPVENTTSHTPLGAIVKLTAATNKA